MKKESLDILDKLIQDKIKQIESFEWFNDSTEAGKILTVVYTLRNSQVRVITAFPASPKAPQGLFNKGLRTGQEINPQIQE